MYLAIYDENKRHITNVDNITYSLTQRVYDPDTFSATGVSAEELAAAKYLILNDERGNYLYSCFVDEVSVDGRARTVKGRDFKTLFDTEVLLDYTAPASFDARLSAVFGGVAALVFSSPDAAAQKIEVNVVIPPDNTDTTATFGSLQDTYKIKKAYDFLKGYLKYYEYNIEARFNPVTQRIDVAFVKTTRRQVLVLADFTHELQTSATTTNKTVATIKFEPQMTEKNEAGEEVTTIRPRPPDIATKYYYLTAENAIVEADAHGDIPGRLYPVKAKIFEAEYLADAQFDAVNELANSRYVDNIVIDSNATLDPIDLAQLPLYTKCELYANGRLYKTLPVSEKTTTADGKGVNTKVKLGFKKILLTEVIKAAGGKTT